MTDATLTVDTHDAKKKQTAYEPIRFYLDSPFNTKRIYINPNHVIQFRNGTFKARTQEEADAIRNARSLLGRVWEEDFPESRKTEVCPVCGYQIRSFDAAFAHQKTHPATQ